jgi:hypothetical protein
MKTTIQITDFSENTLQLFNQAKEKKSCLLAFDLVRLLIDNDYPVKDVKEFMKHNFKNDYKFLDYSI